MEKADLVIVGAGWYGLTMAKTYQQVNPNAKVVVYDKSNSVGGVWAKERLYDFYTNNVLGSFEFSDFPMTEEHFNVKPHHHIPAATVCDYLCQYADKFDIARLIRFRTKVESAELQSGGTWVLSLTTDELRPGSASNSQIEAKLLVVATGILSHPLMPALTDSINFNAPFFHSQDLGKHAEHLKTAKSVVVFGASKSAWDSCYVAATGGSEVHWIIRAKGNGPVWMTSTFATPFKLPMDLLLMTRCLTWFSPCIWGGADGYGWIQRLLHNTWLGRKIVEGYWKLISDDIIANMGYDGHPETEKLKARNTPFWGLSSTSMKNYDTEFMDLVRNGKITVHIADIARLSPRAVHLSDGTMLPAEAFVCATGWTLGAHIKILPEDMTASFGLPHYSAVEDELVEAADKVILETFPCLREGPTKDPQYEPMISSTSEAWRPNQPFRMYRFLVPPSPKMLRHRNLAFASAHHVTLKPIVAQVQALWLTAYFGNKIQLPPDDEVAWSTILWSRFVKWRWPACAGGAGEKYPEMTTEWMPYVDVLLQDLGLKTPRKKWWWDDIFVPYKQKDYAGLVEEWMAMQEKNDSNAQNAIGKKTKVS